MLKSFFSTIILCLCATFLIGQNFELTVIGDTVKSGPADPMTPIIFDFEATNTTDNTFLVDMIRSNVNIPEGWETALCTEACFPPNISDAVFFLDEMATDEPAFYFYPSSVGSGSATITFINREDTTNYFQQSVFVNTTPLSIDEIDVSVNQAKIFSDRNTLYIQHDFELNQELTLLDINGKIISRMMVFDKEIEWNISAYAKGSYILKFANRDGILISF